MRQRAFYSDPASGCLTNMWVCSGLHILIPGYDSDSRPAGLTDEEYFNVVVERDMPPGAVWYAFDELDTIWDRTFRDAWEGYNGILRVNMDKARGIHMDRIRVARNAELVTLDVSYMRALESGDTTEQRRIANVKQTLRDIPQTYDLTTSLPSELLNKWPILLLKG